MNAKGEGDNETHFNCKFSESTLQNIPYGQSSAKLPVILSPNRSVTWSLGYLAGPRQMNVYQFFQKKDQIQTTF